MKITKISDQLQRQAQQIVKEIDFDSFCSSGESWEIDGSVSYNLLVPEKLDIDIKVYTIDVLSSFQEKMDLVTKLMIRNPNFRKLRVTNLHNRYKKAGPKTGNVMTGFVIDLGYVTDRDLTKADTWSIEIWITDKKSENHFPELLNLSEEDRGNLLEVKSSIYRNYPDCYLRSYMIYKSFLEGKRTEKEIIDAIRAEGIMI